MVNSHVYQISIDHASNHSQALPHPVDHHHQDRPTERRLDALWAHQASADLDRREVLLGVSVIARRSDLSTDDEHQKRR